MDIETQIKALRLAWIPRILDSNKKGPWKSYFNYYLKPYGGTFLLKCNYELKDLTPSLSGFYSDLLLWWEEFRNTFSDNNYAQRIIWNTGIIRTLELTIDQSFINCIMKTGLYTYATCYLNLIICSLMIFITKRS